MDTNLKWLYAGRALRSFATAFLTVVFPLYLAATGYTSAKIGLVLTAGSIASAALFVVVGFGGDRFGRRRMLIMLALLGTAGSLMMAASRNLAVVMIASGIGGIGRGGGAGSGGSWGPVFPAEQPLVAASVDARRRTAAFGTIAFVGVIAGAVGSLVAYLPEGLHSAGWSWPAAYRSVFLVGAILSAGMALVTLPVRDAPPTSAGQDRVGAATAAPSISTRQLVTRLALTNGFNGLGFGFLGPLLTYWFYVRYGVGPGSVGMLYALVNVVTALPYLGAARLTERWGAVRTVTVTRALSVATLLAVGWMPSFTLAGAVFALRMALNSLGLPARQSYVMGVADERRRGAVAALSALPSQLTAAVSPAIGGLLMESFVDAPIYGAVLFMGCNVVAFYYAFRGVPPPEEAETARQASPSR